MQSHGFRRRPDGVGGATRRPHYKVKVKDGAFKSSYDGSKVEVNGGVGPVGLSADSEGKVGGSLDLGAASISGDSTGAVEVSSQGITVSWNPDDRTLDFKFEPEFSWGPATIKTTLEPGHGLVTTLTINLELAEGWAITIEQQYEVASTIPPEVYQQRMIEFIDDWFMNKVNGGQGGLEDLIRALRGW